MLKNAAQKWIVFAFDRTTNIPKTGDAAQITANLRIDGAAANAVDDTNPTELEDGFYVFTITAAESNGDNIVICPSSSTANIQVIGVPGALWTDRAAQVLTANWEITGNQLIIYDTDGTTALYTFNLTRDSEATEFNPDKRVIV